MLLPEKSLSITIILQDESPDVFSVLLSDGQDGLFDMTSGYQILQAKIPDGRVGLMVVAVDDKHPTIQFDPFSMPEEERP